MSRLATRGRVPSATHARVRSAYTGDVPHRRELRGLTAAAPDHYEPGVALGRPALELAERRSRELATERGGRGPMSRHFSASGVNRAKRELLLRAALRCRALPIAWSTRRRESLRCRPRGRRHPAVSRRRRIYMSRRTTSTNARPSGGPLSPERRAVRRPEGAPLGHADSSSISGSCLGRRRGGRRADRGDHGATSAGAKGLGAPVPGDGGGLGGAMLTHAFAARALPRAAARGARGRHREGETQPLRTYRARGCTTHSTSLVEAARRLRRRPRDTDSRRAHERRPGTEPAYGTIHLARRELDATDCARAGLEEHPPTVGAALAGVGRKQVL